jgi:hypothetical protein
MASCGRESVKLSMQERNDMHRQLFLEGNREIQIMGVTFAKRGGNICDRHVQRYRQMMTEWAQDGIFEEGVTMTERGVQQHCRYLPCTSQACIMKGKNFDGIQEIECSESTCKASTPHS